MCLNDPAVKAAKLIHCLDPKMGEINPVLSMSTAREGVKNQSTEESWPLASEFSLPSAMGRNTLVLWDGK